MAVYMVIDTDVLDPDLYARYLEAVPEVISRFGGRYLARGGRVWPLSDSWRPERVTVLEFQSKERLDACFASPEYALIAPWREASARSRAIVVEGCTN